VIHVIDQVLAPSWVTNSIVDRAVASPNLSTLVSLVTLAELVEPLGESGSKLTVFAPTDDAFNALLAALNVGVEYFTDDNPTFLSEVLTYHVVTGIYTADELVGGLGLRTLQGERLFFDVTDGTTRVNGQEILGSVLANNGIVHVVGGVLAPSIPFPATTDNTIVDVAVSLPDSFSTLVALVTQADLVAFLSQPLEFTVFAPTNDAFGALDPGLVAALQTRPYKMHLKSVLSYHVLEGEVFSGDIQDGMMAETLIGESVTFSTSENGVFVNDNAQVVTADVPADNGVIHVINNVLLPPWTSQTCTDVAASDERLTSLVALLSMVGFDDLLSRPGPFTVLAPVNEAFAAFLDDINADLDDLQLFENRFGTVTNLLEYHLFDGIYDSEALKEEPTITTKHGYRVGFDFTNNELTVQGATFNTTDIVAGNGIIHIINRLSLP
jgi:transforming growth factor-beta-induced protein